MNMNFDFFTKESIFNATISLFRQWDITLVPQVREERISDTKWIRQYLGENYKNSRPYTDIKAMFVGVITDSALNLAVTDNNPRKPDVVMDNKRYHGLIIVAVELGQTPNRSQIAELTRAFNREFKENPVGLVLKYENKISIAITERSAYQQEWRDGEKVGKVTILRDINVKNPHTGHLRILDDLKNHDAANYNELYEHWLETLNIDILNKKFFKEISNWYFWAIPQVKFPDDVEKNEDIRNSTNLIRLITRIIFIWFIKEKGLVPEQLFNEKELEAIIKNFKKTGQGNYYNAILQNLFFGTLNQKIKDRKFANDGDFESKKKEYGVKNLYRYASMFKSDDEKAIRKLFVDIPFLNGGLFDCLDREDEEMKVKYVDGFSRNPRKQAKIPDSLFFGEEQVVDLNPVYNTKNKTYKVKGLVKILNSYKFTITENTPQEEDVALDPELLGKVFENLLASYNPETKETARKQSGSFYTPREIVNYMVDESIAAYLREKVGEDWENNKQTIKAINEIKILDPACGSGAFPMGILHKMVEILQKLDPKNEDWRRLQEEKATGELKDAIKIEDQQEREIRLKEISDIFENNKSDYGRKLFLIENCIFGVDIQPIAVQISKLRFFLSLVIEQTPTNDANDNYGIKPLPNLETKFVAANTLIGIEKEGTIFRTAEMIEKENELKQVRHEYFTANDRKKKRSLQGKDKKLRMELAKMLKGLGFGVNAADQIASFDPYDQNNSAGWFDAEWMFGVEQKKDGLNEPLNDGEGYFDIVIGNPPYVLLKRCDYKRIYSEKFELQSGKIDLYRLFIEFSIKYVCKDNGILSFITPNTFLTIPSCEILRRYILNNATFISIVNYDETVFDTVSVNSVVFVLLNSKRMDTDVKIIIMSKDNIFDYYLKNDLFLKNTKAEISILANTNEQKLIEKIENNGIQLGDFSFIKISLGVQPYHNTLHTQEKIKSRFLHSKTQMNSSYVIELGGKNIERYGVKMRKDNWLNFDANLYTKPDFKFFSRKRIILREIVSTQLIATYTNEVFLVNKSCYSIISERSDISIKFILGILNSKLIGFYVSNVGDKSKQELFPRITMNTLKKIPIPNIPKGLFQKVCKPHTGC
jgi:hypothetical protein